MIKVVIVEDENPAAEKLIRMLELSRPDIEIIAKLYSVESSINWFSNNIAPDLAFFDIQLGDGISFEIFEQTEINCPVIFTTAYDEFAIKAFKVNSIDYLLKPLNPEDLKKALNKFEQINNAKDTITTQNTAIESLLKAVTNEYKSRFLVKIGDHIKPVNSIDIQCFYSLEKATYILTSTNRNYSIDYSLDQIETMLNPETFFRISRKAIINIEYITDIIHYSSSRLKVKLKDKLTEDMIVSRERVKHFKQWLEK